MKKINTIILGTMLLLTSSCATVVSKSSWPVTINSTPSGANISISDRNGVEIFTGQTPAILNLKSGHAFFERARYQVTFTMDGYEKKTIPVEFKMNGWYWGNILFGWVIGMLVVDPVTGAMYKIEKDNFNETLIKNNSVSSNGQPGLKIIDINDIPEEARGSLVRLD